MAETLSAILLVTTSAKESSLVYRWPPSPDSSSRLRRARPDGLSLPLDLDNPWKFSHYPAGPLTDPTPVLDKEEYQWQRPAALRDRSISFSHSVSHPASGRNSPSKDRSYSEKPTVAMDYDYLFGYSSEFLANILCPQPSMCHQKFELQVDDLAFVGHPVCSEVDGSWNFKKEKYKAGVRGRESRTARSSPHPSPDLSASEHNHPSQSSWLRTFHFVLVLDLPDPSSSASGNVSKYFDIIYEQVAFITTAILYQEQVLSNFVEAECDVLGALKDSCISKGEPFSSFASQALEVSSIATAMRTLYEAIKTSAMAYLLIHDIPLELQLPPNLDMLLHSTDGNEIDFLRHSDDDGIKEWGPEMSFGWRLPGLSPWKSLLLLDDSTGLDYCNNSKGSHPNQDDKILVEGLVRFLETTSVTLSLADMGSLLDWDLETQVFPTVRWLVQHRRAKVVDLVHSGLKTVFTLPQKIDIPIFQLSEEFDKRFSHPSIPPLPKILAIISTAISTQSNHHFFASVVHSKELIPIFHDVVLWMLKRDLLITLHLRVRVVATRDLKIRVRFDRERALARRASNQGNDGHGGPKQEVEVGYLQNPHGASGVAWLPMSPRSARRHFQQIPSIDSINRKIGRDCVVRSSEEREDVGSESAEEETGWDRAEDHLWPSMINDPGRATPLQRRWLSAMSEDKPAHVAKRFELINQYFDGKKTDDEILYRAEISRKELREVLHHYEEYLQTFLHPS